MLEDDYEDDLVQSDLEPENMATNEEIDELKQKLAENDAIIEELMFRQDSLEATRQTDLERRFEMVMRMVRNETNGDRPDLEKRAKQLFMDDDARTGVASAQNPSKIEEPSTVDILNNQKQQDRVAVTDNSSNTAVGRKNVAESITTRNQIIDTKANDLVKPKDAVVANRPRKVVKPVAKSEVVQDGVKSRKFKNLPNVTDGYYVVANVYKGGKYMDKFLTTLNNKGIKADYIDNPDNGLKYVYLQRYETFNDAVAAYDSKLNGKYDGAMWIMNVDNKYTNEAYASNVNKIKNKSSKYDSDVLTTNVVVKDNVGSKDADPKSYIIEGTGSGYYLIANVFANPNNAKKFVKLLNSFGLSASYFINPKNNYRYVYLKKHDSWTNALISYYSKLNDAYNDKMWIMRVNQEQMA
jgi:ribosomal protein S6